MSVYLYMNICSPWECNARLMPEILDQVGVSQRLPRSCMQCMHVPESPQTHRIYLSAAMALAQGAYLRLCLLSLGLLGFLFSLCLCLPLAGV